MSNILILGGSGILSLDVLKECIGKGHDITCVTRGKRDHRFPKGIKIIHCDVCRLEDALPQFAESYDAVLDFLSLDVKGLKYKLDILGSRCKQYFFVSSATAYSFEDKIVTEKTKLGNEYWSYSDNKVKCEEFLENNYKSYGITYTIIRPYVTYGKTRIPFGIISLKGEYWSLANRVINGKPILLWDNGKAKCTLTHTEDFAKAFVDLIGNPQAYNEAYHITSDEVLTWAYVLEHVGKALNKEPVIFSRDTEEILTVLPEYTGVLQGDKARDRIFDNSKIKNACPRFKDMKPFSVGIAETIAHYLENPIERKVDYEWDGRIDWAIAKLAKKNGIKIDFSTLRFMSAEKKSRLSDRLAYSRGRRPLFGKVCTVVEKTLGIPKYALKCVVRILSGKKNGRA